MAPLWFLRNYERKRRNYKQLQTISKLELGGKWVHVHFRWTTNDINTITYDFVTWFRSKIFTLLELHLRKLSSNENRNKQQYKKPKNEKDSRCSEIKILRIHFYLQQNKYKWKKFITYTYPFISRRVSNILHIKILIFNIAVTFFPCYYRRKFFYYNQLKMNFYKNETSDLSAVKVGDDLFLKSYDSFSTLLKTKRKPLHTNTYQDLKVKK